MQLAHACDDELARLFVREAAERRVFLRETLQAFRHFVAVGAGFRFHRHADDRLGERGRFQHHFKILVAKRVAGPDIAQADQRRNVARVNLFDVLALAALNDHQPADALAFARARVVYRVALPELAGINAEENQLARVSICPQLERQRTKLVVVTRLDRDDIFGARLMALGWRDVDWAGQIIHHRVD